ncbi:hypothetical protein ACLOJK_011948 [Asimina triloba]
MEGEEMMKKLVVVVEACSGKAAAEVICSSVVGLARTMEAEETCSSKVVVETAAAVDKILMMGVEVLEKVEVVVELMIAAVVACNDKMGEATETVEVEVLGKLVVVVVETMMMMAGMETYMMAKWWKLMGVGVTSTQTDGRKPVE